MKRAIVGLIVAGAVLLAPMTAQAAQVRYGTRFTYAHGYIVVVTNYKPFPTRVRCTWYAGQAWVSSWRVNPNQTRWTTSDAGNYGDLHPQNLNCTFRAIYTY